MTFYSAFQWNAFQNNAYQIARAATTTGGSPSKETYSQFYPFQLEQVEKEKRAALKKQKSDLDRLDSVLAETRRLAAIAAENKLLAKEKRALELAAKEQEYLEEINRLLMVRVELVLKMRRNQQFIIALVLMKKRRLRVLH
jgi:hypothetical protein